MRRARRWTLAALLGLAAACGRDGAAEPARVAPAPTSGTVALSLQTSAPAADVARTLQRRLERVSADGLLPLGAVEVTAPAPDRVQVEVGVMPGTPCDPARLDEAAREVEAWVTRSGRLGIHVPFEGAAPGVAAQVQAWPDATAELRDGAVWVRGPATEEVAARLPGLRVPGGARVLHQGRDAEGETAPVTALWVVATPGELDNRDVASARAGVDDLGHGYTTVTFTADGAERFEALTARRVGAPLIIALEDAVVAAPVVMARITGGQAQLSTGAREGGEAQARRRAMASAALLASGALDGAVRVTRREARCRD